MSIPSDKRSKCIPKEAHRAVPEEESVYDPFGNPEETLRRFYDSASVLMGTVEINQDDIIHVSDNRATADFFGTTPEAMKGRSARAMGVPDSYVNM